MKILKARKLISALLAVVMITTSMPQTDLQVYAADRLETESETTTETQEVNPSQTETKTQEEETPEDEPSQTENETKAPETEPSQTETKTETESETETTETKPSQTETESETETTETEPSQSKTETETESETETDETEPSQTETESETETDEPQTEESELSQETTETEYETDVLVSPESGENTEYLIDDTLGYHLTDITVEPWNHAASFSLKSSKALYTVGMLYTTDQPTADNFFPNVTNVTVTDAETQGFAYKYFYAAAYRQQLEDGTVQYISDGDCLLEPDTTYYYRLVYHDENASTYYFLTVPDELKTYAAVETSHVTIDTIESVETGYNRADIAWTVNNPMHEYIIIHGAQTYWPRLYYTDTDDFTRAPSSAGEKYRNADKNVISGKYHTIIPTEGNVLNTRPELYVYTGASKSRMSKISAGNIFTVTPADISKAEVTTEETGSYNSFQVQVQLSPWYAVDYALSADLSYRVKDDENWISAPRASLSDGAATITVSNLGPGMDYEYYIELKDYARNPVECLLRYGSETQPYPFSTRTVESYEDIQFPDDAFRNYIKNQIGISTNEKITSDQLDKLTSLYCYQSQTKDTIKSLEGIQYLKNLTYINFNGHAITNADILGGMTGLETIHMNGNDLTQMPDLSKLSNLKAADFRMNKIASGITADKLPAAFLAQNTTWLSDTANYQRKAAGTPGQTEINAKYSELSWSMDIKNTYTSQPSTESPYAAGQLSDTSLNNALNALNFVRYVAGIPSNVTLNNEYTKLAQAGALVNCVDGVLTHYPSQPSGMSDELYQKGYKGCSSSNLAMGYSNLASSIINAWIYDHGSDNLNHVGHRRWALNPSMDATGFGAVGSYSAMYALSYNGNTTIYDFVAWPARNMPIELMGESNYPWSVSLGTDYQTAQAADITVTMKETGTGKKWTFNQKNSSYDGNYFSVDNSGYGRMGSCIIFRPKMSEVSYSTGSKFEITISGLKDRAGNAKTLQYTVNFFSLGNSPSIGVSLNKSTLRMMPGQSDTLTATITPSDISDKTITWSSSNPSVATVDENGKVTAIAVGDATITAATAYKGKKATCKVIVRNYTLSKTELSFDLADGTRTETLWIDDGIGNTIKEVTWSSNDESVATVSKGGVVTPTGSGTAQVRAEVTNGPSFVCDVTVKNNVLRSISLNTQECTLEKGAVKRLKVYYFPNDTTLSKEIVWSSDQPDVASVNENGMVTALSQGTAVITATVGGLEAKCTVTVSEAATPDEGNIPSNLYALTNVQTTLSDISLAKYEGWEWENGDIPLSQFAGAQEKSFAAIYHREGYADYRTTLNVSLATLTGISIVTDRTTLRQNDEASANIQWKVSGSEFILSDYAKDLNWSSSNPDIVEITASDTNTAITIKTKGTTGKAVISAEITLSNANTSKTYKARCALNVTEGDTAEYQNISLDGFVPAIREGTSLDCYEGTIGEQTGGIHVTVTNATKLTVKSSNAKVVAAGKVQAENGQYYAPLTIKAAGTARLTLTANDAAKTVKEIILYVRDPQPNISETTITVNKLKTSGTTFHIYPNDGYVVTGYALTGTGSSNFEALVPGAETDSCVIKAKSGTSKGTYKPTIKVTVTSTTATAAAAPLTYEFPLTVKVTEQSPKYKVKQSAKANLFYVDFGAPRLTITTEENLTGLELTQCDFKLTETEIAGEKAYIISPSTNSILTTSSCSKKGLLKLSFDGYEPISVPYTVSVEKKTPKLSPDSKTATLYPNAGVYNTKIKIKSGGQVLALDTITAELQNANGCELTKTDDTLILNGSNLTSPATIKAQIRLTCGNWREAVTLPYTIKVNAGKPTVKLQKTSLQLNIAAMAYDMAQTEVMWKNGAVFDEDTKLSVSAANAKSQAMINDSIVFEQIGNQIIAKLNNKNVATGSYKFKVNATNKPSTSAPLTVKVVNTELTKAVKTSLKGSIDVLNRSGSRVVVTPSLKALNGEITDVKLTGRFAHLFYAKLDKDNKISVYARDVDANGKSIALITKYNYTLKLYLTLQNAEGDITHLTTSELKLKLKQGKPKVTITPKNATFFSGAYNSVRPTVTAVLNGSTNPEITNIELINYTDLFGYSNGILTLSDTGAAVKGKTYNLQFRLTFKGQADNEKSMVVKYNVKVK